MLIRRAARSYGLLDPFMLLARLRQFAQPSEVEAPLELIRAWTVFQARGIVNTRAIQHNLDWVWPYWVERQFNPRDVSFIPRSFSMSHINLTHRNWTAVCLPDTDLYTLVDPCGMATPLHDGWSVEAWIIHGDKKLVPSRCCRSFQEMIAEENLILKTRTAGQGISLESSAEMIRNQDDKPELHLNWKGEAEPGAQICIALRPYNTEGIQFIDSIKTLADGTGWKVNGKTDVLFSRNPDQYCSSDYASGDVFNMLRTPVNKPRQTCPVGMATAAAIFSIGSDGAGNVQARIPLEWPQGKLRRKARILRAETTWKRLDDMSPGIDIPDAEMKRNYICAVRTLQSLSSGEICPGSYTYRRFWFRDACLMLNALLAVNHHEAARRAFEGSFARRQTARGFFESQQGEWDSNGQALWVAGRYESVSGRKLTGKDLDMLRKGAEWIKRKRRVRADKKPEGFLPAGFSAEHLGPNNFFYWDNFWGIAGLRAAAEIFENSGEKGYAAGLRAEAGNYFRDVVKSISSIPADRSCGAIPAAPNRRMDTGAIGSLAADYPLQLFKPGDERIMRTVDFLMDRSILENGFFHDMTHSGVNPYLTLHLAQVLLRAGDRRYKPLVKRISQLATPTGQWPEAIHPATGGGCMGDGQHGWAAAEWVLMMRALFVREEPGKLIVGSGLFPEWLESESPLRYGPTATRFGDVAIDIDPAGRKPKARVQGRWHDSQPEVIIDMPSRKRWQLDVQDIPGTRPSG